MPGYFSVSIKDYDGETGTFRGETAELTAANWAAMATQRGDLTSAIAAVSDGVIQSYRYGNREVVDAGASDDSGAQRELKMLVQYHDAVTGEVLQPFEIPCPDLSNLDENDRSHFNIGDAGVIDDLVTAIEAYVLSPALNSVEVDELTLVGRRL